MTKLPSRTALIVGGLATPPAVTAFWMAADHIALEHALVTPFPYLFFAPMWVVVIPVYVALQPWFGMRLPRLMAAGVTLPLPPTALGYSYFLLPRAHFAAFLMIGAGIVGALAFWASLRLVTRLSVDSG